jgi:hypothetical protein
VNLELDKLFELELQHLTIVQKFTDIVAFRREDAL